MQSYSYSTVCCSKNKRNHYKFKCLSIEKALNKSWYNHSMISYARNFVFKIFIYLKVRATAREGGREGRIEQERERERERERDLPSTVSISNSQDCTKPKQGARSFFQVFHMGSKGPNTWATLHCCPRHPSRELRQMWRNWARSQSSIHLGGTLSCMPQDMPTGENVYMIY